MLFKAISTVIIFSSSDQQIELCWAKSFPDGGLLSFGLCKSKGLEERLGEKFCPCFEHFFPHESNHLFSYLCIFFSMYWIPLLPKMRYCSWINQQRFRELLTELCIYLVGTWKPVSCLRSCTKFCDLWDEKSGG